MTTSIAGVGFDLHPGDEREFQDAEAIRLISAEYAVPVAAETERAVLFAPAAGVRRRGRPRKDI